MSSLRLLIKPALFTAGVCGTCFCGAAIAQYEIHKSQYQRRRVPRILIQEWVQWQEQKANDFRGSIAELKRTVRSWTSQLSTGHKLAYGTIFCNLVVLAAWRSQRLQPVMVKYFLNQISIREVKLSPMILSFFSHISPLHLACNMYALYSFSNVATHLLGPEQLVGLFFAAGTVSSLTSLAHMVLANKTTPSLGASGALLGVIAYVCVKIPDSELRLFFIPLAAGTALKGLILFDTVGMLARWSFVDHAAHLGGTLFGVWYGMKGERLYYRYRGTVVDKWNKLKS